MLFQVIFEHKSGYVFVAEFLNRDITEACFVAICAGNDTAEAAMVSDENQPIAEYRPRH